MEEMHDWKIQRKKAKNRITTKEFNLAEQACYLVMMLCYRYDKTGTVIKTRNRLTSAVGKFTVLYYTFYITLLYYCIIYLLYDEVYEIA